MSRVVHKRRVIPGSVAGDSRLAALVIEFGVIFIAAPFFAVVGKMPVAVRSPVRITAVAVRPLPVAFPVFVRVAEKRGDFRDVTKKSEQIIVLRGVIDHGKVAPLLPAEIRHFFIGRKPVSGSVIECICMVFFYIEFIRKRLGKDNVFVGILLHLLLGL